jgi:quercetin dioxygenase-like cupin family protein
MECTRFDKAKPYTAPKHNACSSFRLQGLEASATKNFWVGLSHFLPGGGADLDASPYEKVYVVTAGELTVVSGGQTVVLRVNDSCLIPANEARTVVNHTNLPASMVVIFSKVSEAV